MPALVTAFGSVYMDLASGIDVKAEKARLTKEIEGLEKIISSIENKLGNPALPGKLLLQLWMGPDASLQKTTQRKRKQKMPYGHFLKFFTNLSVPGLRNVAFA